MMVMMHRILAMVLTFQIPALQCKIITGVNRIIDSVFNCLTPRNRHPSRSYSTFVAEQKLQHRCLPPVSLTATPLSIFIFTETTEHCLLRFLKVRKHSHNLADPQLFFCSEMCCCSRSHAILQPPALVETSASPPVVVCHRRRLLPESIATINMSVCSIILVGGGGMFITNPSNLSNKSVGSDGHFISLSSWVNKAFELVGLGLIVDYCLIKTVHFPRVNLMFLWGLFGLPLFNYLWVLKLVIGMEHSLSVVVVIAKSFLVHYHLLKRAFIFVFTLTSLSIFRSSVRECPLSRPLFKSAIFPGRIISDRRLYSLCEKFQTAYKRTLVEILKAALSWSPFEECAITCITHLDPIE